MSCDPYDDSSSDRVAFAVYLRGLDVAFARPGDGAWTVIEYKGRHARPLPGPFVDVVHYRGKFYTMTFDRDVFYI